MLTMDQINHIRKLRNEEDYSLNKIAILTGYDWSTVKKYADGDGLPKEKKAVKRGMMYTKGVGDQTYGEIVDALLFEDSKEKKKDRRQKKAIHKILKEDYDFPGSYRLVCQYIADTHEEVQKNKAYERLEHPPGEAQLDFGNYRVCENGKLKNIKLLVLVPPYSNRSYVAALPRENKECFLEGLKRIFERMGVVPRTLRIDNLAAGVVRSRGRGEETVFTDELKHFSTHYGFEPIACNPFSGHEKGSVENKVGYIRYNFFDRIPEFESYLSFEDWINHELDEDSHRRHYQEHLLISELWEEDRMHMLSLPETSFPIFRYEDYKTNKYGEIRLDGQSIHIPRAGRNHRLTLQLKWDTFKCLNRMGEILYEGVRPYINDSQPVDWSYVFQTYRKKPRVLNHSKYKKLIPPKIKSYLLETDLKERIKRITQLLELLQEFDLIEIEEKFEDIVLKSLHTLSDDSASSLSLYDALSPKVVAH